MKKHIIPILAIIAILLNGCLSGKKLKDDGVERGDIEEIREQGELVAVTLESAISYYTYGNDESGFDYALAQNLADNLELPLKMLIAGSREELEKMLERGEADIAIYKLAPTKSIREKFLVSNVQTMSRVVLVQPDNKKHKKVKNIMDLIDKTVHVQRKSRYATQLKHINDEVGGGINIKYLPDTLRIEDIIYMVSQGEITYTFADDDIADLSQKYLKNIDVSVPISVDLPRAWLVRRSAPKLDSLINNWYNEVENSRYLKNLTSRYLNQSKYFDMLNDDVDYKTFNYRDYNGGISPYDSIFKSVSKITGWDWRLLASVAFHESRFNPDAVSYNGAMGVMQLMSGTGRKFGLTDSTFFVPSENIKAGAKLLASLEKKLMFIEDKNQRIKAVLAAYNTGHGHLLDAVNLAKKYDGTAQSWDTNISKYLMLKSEEKYYTDEVVKLGYFRANHTIKFVNSVMITYDSFKQRTK